MKKLKNMNGSENKGAASANKKEKTDKDTKRKLKIIIPICVASVILITAVLSAVLLYNGNKPTNTDTDTAISEETFYSELKNTDLSKINIEDKTMAFISGIKIGNYDISGKMYNDVYSYIEKNGNKFVDKLSYVINCDGSEHTLTEADFVYNINVLKAVDEAYALSTFARSKNLKALPEDTDIELEYEIEPESISMAVDKIAELVDDKATGLKLESFDASAPEGKQFVFKDSGGGKTLDREDVTNKLTDMIKSKLKTGTITCSKKAPEGGIVASELNKQMKLISTFSTYSTNGSNGNHNMALALSSVDGTLLNPGDTFSFNECTGDSNLTSLGYLPAGVIINGKSDIGVGGGICQASTTIYNAALRAGMTVVERYPHAWPSTYAKQGLDATIDYPALDLKLKNNADTPIYFNCYMQGVTLTCNIYGVQPEEWDEITCDSWVTGSASDGGFNVAASRTYWLNGKEVKTEELKSSHYSSWSAPSSGSGSSSSSKKPSSSKNSSSKSSSKVSSSESSSQVPSEITSNDFPSSPTDSIIDISSDLPSVPSSSYESDIISYPVPDSETDGINSSDNTSAEAP